MIEFKNVTKIYNGQTVINNQNIVINDGEFFVLVGSSGSGKTTTLKMINRLVEPSGGEILIDDKNIKTYKLRDLRLNTGYVLQKIALFPNLTVLENIELIPEMKKWHKSKRVKRSIELLKMVALDPDIYLNRYPKELSGGEAQRIGILRAIIAEPKVLLMDEPFSALDPISRNQLQDLIKTLHKKFNMTIVFVTHQIDEAIKLADRICIMSKGKVIQTDTYENIKKFPASEFVVKFFGGEINE